VVREFAIALRAIARGRARSAPVERVAGLGGEGRRETGKGASKSVSGQTDFDGTGEERAT
jgi:hypothetical protein